MITCDIRMCFKKYYLLNFFIPITGVIALDHVKVLTPVYKQGAGGGYSLASGLQF